MISPQLRVQRPCSLLIYHSRQRVRGNCGCRRYIDNSLTHSVDVSGGCGVGRGCGCLGGGRVFDVDWKVLLLILATLWALDIDSLLVCACMVPLGVGAYLMAGNKGMLHLNFLLLGTFLQTHGGAGRYRFSVGVTGDLY